jgi:lysophospholipase L1-like esterase
VTCLAIFGLGEFYLRWRFGLDVSAQQPDWNRFDEQRGWVLRPGEYSYVNVAAFRRVEASINSLGLRNRPISLTAADGIERISVLGDSFVFSTPLRDGERFTDKLQEVLGPKYEVVNLGIQAYGTGQEILFLEDLIAKGYEVGSRVLLVFFTNDLQDNQGLDYGTLRRDPVRPAFSVSPTGALRVEPAVQPPHRPPPPFALRAWLQQSLFYGFVLDALVNIVIANPWMIDIAERVGVGVALPRTPGIVAGWYSEGWRERWQTTEAILGYTVRKVRELTTADIVLVYMPSPFQTDEVFRRIVASRGESDPAYRALFVEADRPQRMLERFAESHGVSYLDLSATLRDDGSGQALYFRREGHLNEEGSERVARALAAAVCRQDRDACEKLGGTMTGQAGRR